MGQFVEGNKDKRSVVRKQSRWRVKRINESKREDLWEEIRCVEYI